MENNKSNIETQVYSTNDYGLTHKKPSSLGQTFARLLTVISAAAGAFFIIIFLYIMATDGLANMRGEPESGWGALVAIIFLVPLITACFLGLVVGIKLRKKP